MIYSNSIDVTFKALVNSGEQVGQVVNQGCTVYICNDIYYDQSGSVIAHERKSIFYSIGVSYSKTRFEFEFDYMGSVKFTPSGISIDTDYNGYLGAERPFRARMNPYTQHLDDTAYQYDFNYNTVTHHSISKAFLIEHSSSASLVYFPFGIYDEIEERNIGLYLRGGLDYKYSKYNIVNAFYTTEPYRQYLGKVASQAYSRTSGILGAGYRAEWNPYIFDLSIDLLLGRETFLDHHILRSVIFEQVTFGSGFRYRIGLERLLTNGFSAGIAAYGNRFFSMPGLFKNFNSGKVQGGADLSLVYQNLMMSQFLTGPPFVTGLKEGGVEFHLTRRFML